MIATTCCCAEGEATRDFVEDGFLVNEKPAGYCVNSYASYESQGEVLCCVQDQSEVLIKGRVDGTWIDSSGTRALYHFISGKTLRWADNSTTTIQRVPDSNAFTMDYEGKPASAQLDPSGTKLEWSDGDTWTRAGIDGTWREGKSTLVHLISGASIRTRGTKVASKAKSLTIINEHCFSIPVGDRVHKAKLDPTGQALLWDDNDVWTRVALTC